MKNIKLSLKSEAEVRLDRLSELKSNIHKGIYKVDAKKLAGNILLESLHMLSQKVKSVKI